MGPDIEVSSVLVKLKGEVVQRVQERTKTRFGPQGRLLGPFDLRLIDIETDSQRQLFELVIDEHGPEEKVQQLSIFAPALELNRAD